jgi:hypothetical protein
VCQAPVGLHTQLKDASPIGQFGVEKGSPILLQSIHPWHQAHHELIVIIDRGVHLTERLQG